jgi:hypothetical protein
MDMCKYLLLDYNTSETFDIHDCVVFGGKHIFLWRFDGVSTKFLAGRTERV